MNGLIIILIMRMTWKSDYPKMEPEDIIREYFQGIGPTQHKDDMGMYDGENSIHIILSSNLNKIIFLIQNERKLATTLKSKTVGDKRS